MGGLTQFLYVWVKIKGEYDAVWSQSENLTAVATSPDEQLRELLERFQKSGFRGEYAVLDTKNRRYTINPFGIERRTSAPTNGDFKQSIKHFEDLPTK